MAGNGMPEALARLIGPQPDGPVTEVRLRAERPVEIRTLSGSRLLPGVLAREALSRLLDELAAHSLYAWQEQLRQGFFTLPDGSRVGVTGRFVVEDGRVRGLTHIGSACLRLAHEVPGCAAPLSPLLCPGGRPESALILSPPGLGKTTLLRDIARCFSLGIHGFSPCQVGIADERGELAACRQGIPSLEVGPRTDVCDGCPKALALPMLVRTMGSRVLVTDELGGREDARAVLAAHRCGTAVVASAHAADLREARGRPGLSSLLSARAFSRVVELGDGVGEIRRVVAL